MSPQQPRERVRALDAIRGLLIIGMVLDHILYDCVVYLGLPEVYFDNPIRYGFHIAGAALFVLMSGMSGSISRSVLKRGLMLAVIAGLVTLCTWVIDHDAFIVFGILHMLAAAMLLYGLTRKLIDKIPRAVRLILWLGLLILTVVLTKTLNWYTDWSWLIGFAAPSFVSLDYFPLLPWVFVYLLGVWAGPYVFGYRLPSWFYRIRCRFTETVGKYSLWVYLAHQPVVLGIILIIRDMYFS